MKNIKLMSEKVTSEKPLEIEYIFENTFPLYQDLEKILSAFTPHNSIDILDWKNEDYTHEMVEVTSDTITMVFREMV